MKMLFAVLSLVTASANAATLDCSQVKDKTVTVDIKTTKEIGPLALKLYNCLQNDSSVQAVKQEVVEASRDAGMAGAEFCEFKSPRVTTLTSWYSTRPSQYGEIGGGYVYDVSQPYVCSAVGSGLFEGIVSRAQYRVIASHEAILLDMCAPGACEGKKAKNSVTLTLKVIAR